MGHTGPLPERFLKCIAKEDRAPLGAAGETVEEATARASVKLEREMHDQFAAWLRINGIPFIHARTDRKSTIQEGWPDFTVFYDATAICIEFKMPGKQATDEQKKVHLSLYIVGITTLVAFSSEEAIKLTKTTFNL